MINLHRVPARGRFAIKSAESAISRSWKCHGNLTVVTFRDRPAGDAGRASRLDLGGDLVADRN
jgi:hypothetical protein